MRQTLLVALIVLLIPTTLRADPITIVDTGPGPATLPGSALSSLQWVAVEFNVPTPAVITAVQGWMLVFVPGFLDLALYRDGGEIPGALLFRSRGFINSGSAEWRGLSDLTWAVTPGTYWMGFEAPGPQALNAALPFPVERPLSNGASVDTEFNFDYRPGDGPPHIGVRIFAEPAPIPEPASILLLGTGLAGLVARRRLRRTN